MIATGRDPVPAATRTSLKLRVGVLLLSTVVTLVAGEAAVRSTAGSRRSYDVEMWRYARLLKDTSAWPGVAFWHKSSAHARLYGVEVATNRFGMRTAEIDELRPASVRRVAVLGDSLTLGWGVAQADSFPEVCARVLADTTTGAAPVEVLNFGIGNANTATEAALYEHLARRFGADRVVLAYFVNDAELLEQSSDFSTGVTSELAVWVWSRMRHLRARFDPAARYDAYYASLYRSDSRGWSETRRALRELASRVTADGASLIVMLIPELHRLSGTNPFATEYAAVAREAERSGAEVLDLWPAFQGREPWSLWVSNEDPHPNAAAHAIIARELATVLQRSR